MYIERKNQYKSILIKIYGIKSFSDYWFLCFPRDHLTGHTMVWDFKTHTTVVVLRVI